MVKLSEIQKKLKAPKNQFNDFGKYHYRSCEDILEAVKPLLGDAVLTLSDEIVEIGGRVYVKATATLSDGDERSTVTAFAREAENKKGMDESQITGATSSYARKYALNGMFLIDDNKDADATNQHGKEKPDVKSLKSDINKLMDKAKVEDKSKFFGWFKDKEGESIEALVKFVKDFDKYLKDYTKPKDESGSSGKIIEAQKKLVNSKMTKAKVPNDDKKPFYDWYVGKYGETSDTLDALIKGMDDFFKEFKA